MSSQHSVELDDTHDPQLLSWVASANGHADFPIQNLPLGVFRPQGGEPQPGIAIGDEILSLHALMQAGVVEGEALAACRAALSGPALNAFLALGAPSRSALRRTVSALLAQGQTPRPELLHQVAECEMLLL